MTQTKKAARVGSTRSAVHAGKNASLSCLPPVVLFSPTLDNSVGNDQLRAYPSLDGRHTERAYYYK
jgi:hypothetical protein